MSAILWTRDEIVEAVDGRAPRDFSVTGVSIDSRTVKPGDLFVALAGPNFDGHDFAAAALAAGAAAALVHRRPEAVPAEAVLVEVADTMQALEDLGRFARSRSEARVIAVTGSVGKTGTKEMLKLALGRQGPVYATEGNLNNQWGVPLSLARMPRDTRFGIFEMGMNHPGEIAPLSALARPHVAVITTVEQVHAEFFASTAEIAEAKSEIFAGLESNGVAVLNRDNPHYPLMAERAAAKGARILCFGQHIEADARLLDCAVDPSESHVLALVKDRAISYRLGVPGRHWVMNSLAVLLAARAVGADIDLAARDLSRMSAPKGRGMRHRIAWGGGDFDLIDESYNASPASMKAAFATLAAQKPMKGARRIAVLGDMLELGGQSAAFHAGLAGALIEQGIDLVFTAGRLMENLRDALPEPMRGGHAADAESLAPLVAQALRPGDVAMVKGSAGSKMGKVVAYLIENRGDGAMKRAANGD